MQDAVSMDLNKHLYSEPTTSSIGWAEQDTESNNSNKEGYFDDTSTQQLNDEMKDNFHKIKTSAIFYSVIMIILNYIAYLITMIKEYIIDRKEDPEQSIPKDQNLSSSYWKAECQKSKFIFISYLAILDSKVMSFLSSFGIFKSESNEKTKDSFESSKVLLTACRAWADFHHEPGNASVDEFQSELKKKLKEFIIESKTKSLDSVSQVMHKGKDYLHISWKILVIHFVFFKTFLTYWANLNHWDLTQIRLIISEFEKKSLKEKKAMFVKSQISWAAATEMANKALNKVGQMNTVVPVPTRREMCEYYEYFWKNMNIIGIGYAEHFSEFTHTLLLNEIPKEQISAQ